MCNSCSSGCRECQLANPSEAYSSSNLFCTRCFEGQIIFEGSCSQDCPSGTERITSPSGSVICQKIACPNYCSTCLTSTRCLKCLETDPDDSKVGIFQTFEGQCLKCLPQFGLTSNLSTGPNQVVVRCSEISGDKFWYKRS